MVSTAALLGVGALVLVGFAAVGAWYSRGRVGSVEDFITARDSAATGTLTATVVASSMGAWILFSPAEAGAAFGGVTAVVGYAVGSALPLAVYASLGPRIRRLLPRGHSLTEYAAARYGPAMAGYVLVVSVAYMFIFLAAEFTGIALVMERLAGVPGWQTATLVGVTVLAYTAYGGLRASIVTDRLQTLVILPLFFVGVAVALVALGGPTAAARSVTATRPELLSLGYLPGLEFGVYVAVAILGAELLNQAWWQRVYAGRDDATVTRSFRLAALLVLPMVLVVGLFGPVAAGRGLVESSADASVALFLVVEQLLPEWVTFVFALLALLLVVSSADTLFNAIASVVTTDLPRVADVSPDGLLLVARGFTGVVALGAIVVGAQGYSVLTLFLLADLLAAATFGPLLLGLYSERARSGGVLAASTVGLVVGLAFFPPARGVLAPSFLPAPSFFVSFLSAAGLSCGLAALSTRVGDDRYDLDRLGDEVGRLDQSSETADGAAVADD
ncbi:Na+/proline symporter [Halogranum gelatinilyticum]|uniref:Na+/proline symporter n=1 Tax=Halogranum gelatinilyticum TaxID=660521 RepID=A0A1G9QNN9_9EURY|nr:sodium:proline symporter [Halogranum gelatinilyticum]SDM12618.1 Na+/proline symporter [Halogranum gelatinilyticum]